MYDPHYQDSFVDVLVDWGVLGIGSDDPVVDWEDLVVDQGDDLVDLGVDNFGLDYDHYVLADLQYKGDSDLVGDGLDLVEDNLVVLDDHDYDLDHCIGDRYDRVPDVLVDRHIHLDPDDLDAGLVGYFEDDPVAVLVVDRLSAVVDEPQLLQQRDEYFLPVQHYQ